MVVVKAQMNEFRQLVALVAALALAAACGSDEAADCPDAGADAGTDLDTDTDTDADTDSGSDSETDSETLPDPYEPDPDAVVTLEGGDIHDCLPGLLEGGGAGVYAGWFDIEQAAYVVWMDDWSDPSMILRIKTAATNGGLTEPGSYTIAVTDVFEDICAVCIMVETADAELWAQAGGEVTYTSLAVDMAGIGQPVEGTFSGTLSGGDCTGTVDISFSGVARDATFGPL
jgi:hypothetical protein